MKKWPSGGITFKQKRCEICNKVFEPKCGTQKYCVLCKKVAKRERSRRFEKTEKGKRNKSKYYKSASYKKIAKNSQLKFYYGITFDAYNFLLKKQNSVCAICGGVNTDNRRLHVDHNHETNEVRGLLCFTCNAFLGLAKSDVGILKSAINYLIPQKRKPRGRRISGGKK